jgi:RNA polymerase sigma-70 factor (ECF subfamily)
LLQSARTGDEGAFELLVANHRRELLAHCYRMLGSVQDAEDALQESLLGAWRGLRGFEGRSSLRAWLYRICTNACLRLISRRPRRILSPEHGPALEQTEDLGTWVEGPVWLEPWPDDPPAPETDDPATSYERREGVELAFVAALQHLPGTQRAVLQFSAAETAEILDTSTASVNSALQRARQAVAERVPDTPQQVELDALGEDGRRELVDAFVAAWERADIPALLELLTEDARDKIERFFTERMFATPWQLVRTSANGQPAFVCYQGSPGGGPLRLGAVNLLTVQDGRIAAISAFLDPDVIRTFGLPEEFPEEPPGDR